MRVAAAAGVLTLAFAALVTTTQIDVKLGPEAGGTFSRSDDDWGEYLVPALRDFGADALRRYEGRRERAGAPPFEREQILASYSVRAQDGWRLLRLATVALFFASLFEVARCATRRPSLAAVVAATCGGVIWALIHDRSFECAPDSSECYRGLTTLLAFAAAGLAWAAYGLGVALGRLRLRRPRPPRPPT